MERNLLAEQFLSIPAAILRARQQAHWKALLKQAALQAARPEPKLKILAQAVHDAWA